MSMIEDFATYKALESSFANSSEEACMDMAESEAGTTPPRIKQLCIKLWINDFAEFAALAAFFGESRQTFGRLCIQNSVESAIAALRGRGLDKHVYAATHDFLAKHGFKYDRNGPGEDDFYVRNISIDESEEIQADLKEMSKKQGINLKESEQ